MNDYISKPIDIDELLTVIYKNLGISDTLRVLPKEKVKTDHVFLTTDNCSLMTEIFDYQEFLNRLGGNEESLNDLIKEFPQYISKEIKKLKIALDEKNVGNIRLHAHSIKGICANTAAQRLSKAAHRIEMIGEQGGTEMVCSLEKLEQEFEILQSVLSEIFPDILQIPAESQPAEAEEILTEAQKECLPELIRRLKEEMLPKSQELIEVLFLDDIALFAGELREIADKYPSGFLDHYIRNFENSIQRYDFNKMEKLLAEFPELIDKLDNAS
jgi:HPt (histidine-containing phosphotransfer) domain-containing protein